jgi:hypothetical protein
MKRRVGKKLKITRRVKKVQLKMMPKAKREKKKKKKQKRKRKRRKLKANQRNPVKQHK